MNPKYKALARKHWQEWLPQKVADLKAEGQLDQSLTTAAVLATRRVVELMGIGYQLHEAEEVALQEYIRLAPEEDPDDPEAIELERLEKEYRDQRRRELAIFDEANMPDPEEFSMQPTLDPRTSEERAQALQKTRDRIANLTPEQKQASLDRHAKAMTKL